MKPLRFCMFTTFYPPYHFGGDAIGIQRLCRGLAKRGHEVTVIHDLDAYRLLSKDDTEKELANEPGIECVPLQSRFPLVSETLTQQFGRPVVHGNRIRKILDEGKFDVINYHNVSLVGGPGLFRFGDATKLYLAHEHWLVCAMHVLWRHGRERCDEKQCMRCTLNHKRPPQWWRWTGLLEREARHVDLFVAMSEFSRRKHQEFGFPREMEVLPYFLPDPEEAAEASTQSSPHTRPYFLFVGRLEKIKGLDDVLPVFERFDGADLLIAGDGDYAAVLKEKARGNDRVQFLGRLAPEELDCYYAHARALIVPSICYETFGIILIESFRQRTPVIVRRVGPLPEIVEKAGGGSSFEKTAELETCLNEMLTDDEQRARMSSSAYDAFLANWTESQVVPRYLELVEKAATKRGDQRVLSHF